MRDSERGMTYIEMMATAFIVLLVAMAMAPTLRVANQRQKEVELRKALREIRMAIDIYRFYTDPAINTPGNKHLEPRNPPYPAKLEDLYVGKSFVNDVSEMKFKALRRLPRDPMTNSTDWGTRALEDEPDSTASLGSNIFDVYTKSKARALDGTMYRDW
jgi:general secretion pathway protein G